MNHNALVQAQVDSLPLLLALLGLNRRVVIPAHRPPGYRAHRKWRRVRASGRR